MIPRYSLIVVTSMFANADGVLVASPRAYESPMMMSSLERWFEQDGRELHLVGPMLNPKKASVAASGSSSEFDEFMARVLEAHGPKSMLYVCSLFSLFPSTADRPDITDFLRQRLLACRHPNHLDVY